MKYPDVEFALCREVGPHLFERADGDEGNREFYTEARSICVNCRILNECREYAVAHEPFHFWGGLTARERAGIRARLNIILDDPYTRRENRYAPRTA